MSPEQKARVSIDTLLQQAGWHVCHMADANIHAAGGVALREFPLNTGYGFADYNPSFAIETFDIIVTDEAHRSIYNLWRQVQEYFDDHLIGFTSTPSKQTFSFFNQNLVIKCGHQQVEAGYSVGDRDRLTRKTRWKELDEDMAYDADALNRAVQPVAHGYD